MKPKHQRLLALVAILSSLSLAVGFVLYALKDNLIFFYSPTQLKSQKELPTKDIRVGGMVQKGSLQRSGSTISFHITDFENTLQVTYEGLTPDLFQEGKGVVAQGILITPTHLQAKTLLAKHDENYMPPEIAKSLKNQATP